MINHHRVLVKILQVKVRDMRDLDQRSHDQLADLEILGRMQGIHEFDLYRK